MSQNKASKIFLATLENFYPMMEFITEQAAANGFAEQTVQQILLAAEEALINIISYAYPDEKGNIEIVCESNERGYIKLTLKDYGVFFDPLRGTKDVDIEASMDQREIGGLGVFIIKNIMEDVNYSRVDGANIFSMSKRDI